MVVNLEISGKMMKEIVKAIENVNEECIWNFDSQGIHIRMSDIYKYKMLDITINKEDLISYSCEGALKVGIVIDRIKDVTKTLKIKDTLTMICLDEVLPITLKSNGLTRSVKLIDKGMVGEVPNLRGAELTLARGFATSMDSLAFKNFLKAASKAIAFEVVVGGGGLIFSSKTDEGLVEVAYGDGDISLKPMNYSSAVKYSVKEVASATSTLTGEMGLRGSTMDGEGDGGLIEVSWNIGSSSFIKALVAPRA